MKSKKSRESCLGLCDESRREKQHVDRQIKSICCNRESQHKKLAVVAMEDAWTKCVAPSQHYPAGRTLGDSTFVQPFSMETTNCHVGVI